MWAGSNYTMFLAKRRLYTEAGKTMSVVGGGIKAERSLWKMKRLQSFQSLARGPSFASIFNQHTQPQVYLPTT